MSLDRSNPRHFAGFDDRASRNWRKDAQSLYAANVGSGWIPRAGFDDDWYSGRVAVGTCGRRSFACWMEFVCGCSNAPSERAELVCGCPRATGATLCSRGASKAFRRKAAIGLTPAASGPYCPRQHLNNAHHPLGAATEVFLKLAAHVLALVGARNRAERATRNNRYGRKLPMTSR
jgi:hypothetical protein